MIVPSLLWDMYFVDASRFCIFSSFKAITEINICMHPFVNKNNWNFWTQNALSCLFIRTNLSLATGSSNQFMLEWIMD